MDGIDFFRNQHTYLYGPKPMTNSSRHAVECLQRWIPQMEDMLEVKCFGGCERYDCRKCRAENLLRDMIELLRLCEHKP